MEKKENNPLDQIKVVGSGIDGYQYMKDQVEDGKDYPKMHFTDPLSSTQFGIPGEFRIGYLSVGPQFYTDLNHIKENLKSIWDRLSENRLDKGPYEEANGSTTMYHCTLATQIQELMDGIDETIKQGYQITKIDK